MNQITYTIGVRGAYKIGFNLIWINLEIACERDVQRRSFISVCDKSLYFERLPQSESKSKSDLHHIAKLIDPIDGSVIEI